MAKSSSKVGNNGLMTMNGNVMCAVDCETTGLVAGLHDIIEFACQPLGADLKPMPNVIPFVTLIKPKERYPDKTAEEINELIEPAMKVNGLNINDVKIYGLDPYRAGDLFEEWFENLKLAPYKKIVPLAKNWRFDAGFITDWLGPKTFEALFMGRLCRDLQPVAHYLNDLAEFEGRKPPFPQTSLSSIRSYLKIPPRNAHRALDDCLTTAECYRAICRGEIPDPDDR